MGTGFAAKTEAIAVEFEGGKHEHILGCSEGKAVCCARLNSADACLLSWADKLGYFGANETSSTSSHFLAKAS
jgi:hypothetical protein